ncbi:hypothetical protein WME95_42980 [Sorangium sp. So ce327]|jgi:hypothetical protein|uniref:hypothetical protein n=1 Tax=unclassified Sorangium TaxID=2621164 RepID=UPI003F5E5B3A
MKRIKLKLHSDEYHLSAVGYLFEDPEPTADPAGVRPFSIRNTVFPEFDLDPGNYVFRFRVRNGSGKFQIFAFDPKTNQSTRAEYDTSSGADCLTFRFTVAP